MGLLVARRRPLLRGAMLAGAGAAVYHAGKRHEAREQQEYEDQQYADASQAQPAPAPPPAAGGTGTADELERLKGLLDQGALTPAEFDAAKQKVLGGG
jgi:Short C-terminal domain